MMQLETERLILRPLAPTDAADLQRMTSDGRVSALALNIPHPFPEGAAADWIAAEQAGWATGISRTFTLRLRGSSRFIGVAGLRGNPGSGKAELGYAISPWAWSKGYATEAGRELLRYGFEELRLDRVTANYLAENLASARVLEKLGFRQEARLQPESAESDLSFTLVFCGLLREEYRKTLA